MPGVIIVIMILLAALIVLFVQFATNYNTQVRVLRKFFRAKTMNLEEYLTSTGKIADVNYESVLDNDLLDLYFANDIEDPHPLLVWVHGGGYMGGDKTAVEPWGRILAKKTGVIVASINYRLAPEQHYPGPILQTDEALRFLVRNAEKYRIDPSRVFLAGDSAGAQIVSQYAAAVSNPELCAKMQFTPFLTRENLRGLILCCGMYNMDTVVKTGFPAIKTFLWVYTDEKNFRKKFARLDELSTVRYVTADYPDVFLTCGDADPFVSQAHELADALRQAGVPGETLFFDGSGKRLNHEYQFNLGQRDANLCLMRAVEFLEKRLF